MVVIEPQKTKSVILSVKIGKALKEPQPILTTNFMHSSDKPVKNLSINLSFPPMGP